MRIPNILRRRGVRRLATAAATVALVTVIAAGPAHAALDTDSVRVTGDKVDFGGSVWGIHSPVGSGAMTWSIVDGYYTPRLTGTIHLEDAAGKFARMHVSYWDGGDNLIATRHGGTVHPLDNDHHSWSVDLSPIDLSQIVEAHVCTELSDDGVDFPQVACETYMLYD